MLSLTIVEQSTKTRIGSVGLCIADDDKTAGLITSQTDKKPYKIITSHNMS